MTKNRTPTLVYLDPGMHPGLEVKGLICFICRVRGLVKFKKNQKIRKKLGSVWMGFSHFCTYFQRKIGWGGGGVDVVRPIRVLLGFLDLFKLDKTPKSQLLGMI